MPRNKSTSTPKKVTAKKAAAPAPAIPVDSIKHKNESRPNIPTRELAGFAAEDESEPKRVLYPRDPSLDPQLVWKGKDEQDRQPLEVPAVPIYIQEKIHPQAIIEDLRQRAAAEKPRPLDLFADFNGLDDFAKKVDFYHHDQHWSNRMILGDSLLVMTSLAEKERLKGRVQMIYIDPPYGIKFGSNWQVSTRKRDVKDAKAEDATRQPEQIKAFRDTWKLGIHSYLAYLRDRLTVARELLTESGSIFVQIGDENVHLVRCVLDEVFGSNHAVATIIVKKKGSQKSGVVDPVNDYLLWYSRGSRDEADGKPIKYRQLVEEWELSAETVREFKNVELEDGSQYPVRDLQVPENVVRDYSVDPSKIFVDYPRARLFRANPLTSGGYRTNQSLPFDFGGNTFTPLEGSSWKHTARRVEPETPSGMERLGYAGRLIAGQGTWRFKNYLDDFGQKPLTNLWDNLGGAADPIYVVQTNTEIVKRCILLSTDPGDLVLDPTCGSGTTAYVAEQWGRRWITIDTSRVALALARTRLMAAKFPYYLLADSAEGRNKELELAGAPVADAPGSPCQHDVRRGFVYKRVPHVTSSTIANNPDINEGMTREQIDAAIRKHAETETLYDQPYEDRGVVRVTGPFTVESLSPHRMLPTGEDGGPRAPGRRSLDVSGNYLLTILDNLRKAGVQNTVKQERLTFDRLDLFPGKYIHAEGTFTENGASKAVRVSIGPEFGTVAPEWIKHAALEAIKGSQCDLLLVCGFAFDPHVSEQTQELKKEMRLGNLPILAVRMNPDLAMGDELLKKTGSGNLFMIFGEPDLEIKKEKDGKLTVELRGVDVYDPTTGEVRSHSTDDVACWFIDTDYNGESFFVRHAYFTGAEEPYEKLKRALRAEIDEAAWSALYSTKSHAFDPPKTGKIAVKVINHYGDEVLKVYEAK